MINRIDKIKGLSPKTKEKLKLKKIDEINTELILNKVTMVQKIFLSRRKVVIQNFQSNILDNKLLLVTQTV